MPFATALYAGLVAILLLVLAARVSTFRMRTGVGLGDGGDAAFQRAIRAHANALEWSLPVLLLLLVAELTRAGPVLLHACGIGLVAGRVLHAYGLSRHSGYSFGRFSGTGLTWLVLLVLAVHDILAFVRAAAEWGGG
jgi:uncharacterized membrane protein YecN with MAPEG domain